MIIIIIIIIIIIVIIVITIIIVIIIIKIIIIITIIIIILSPWYRNTGLASGGEEPCLRVRLGSLALFGNFSRDGVTIKILVVVQNHPEKHECNITSDYFNERREGGWNQQW